MSFHDAVIADPRDLLMMLLKTGTTRPASMDDETRRLLADLEALAASITDPEKRAAVRRILARLSDQGREWPDAAELMRLRLERDGERK
jgi:hypothetical protein